MTSLPLRIAFLSLTLTLGACASGPQARQEAAQQESAERIAATEKAAEGYPEPVFTAKRILPPDSSDVTAVYDPWEGMNKRIYNFNYSFDKAVFLPVVRGYKWVMPEFAQIGVHNFYRNFEDLTTAFNSILQLAPHKFFQSTGRVLVNSTIGILGLIDIASDMDIPRPEEDFGQTLCYWGVGQGPYLVLPFLGPSNLRDTAGIFPDLYVRGLVTQEVMSDDMDTATTIVWPIDTRAHTSFRYYQTGSAFEYRMVRWLYTKKDELDVSQ
jgi:phospholipid-binding lipoprotein MlaA